MDFLLDPVETRVLGSLLEKEIATPEYYPLTLNALVNACNQRSNRDPVVTYTEETVSIALESLRSKKLVSTVTGPGIRVPKHRELLAEMLNLGRRELALLCVLMLRGPQTVGELRGRSENLHAFADIDEVQACLQRLATLPSPLVARLERQPGARESRYTQLLAGSPSAHAHSEPLETTPGVPSKAERITALEAEVNRLREEVRALSRQLDQLRDQFE